MTGIIYHAFDVMTGKSYVGQTWSTLEERRKQHHARNSTCRVFREVLRDRSEDFVWTELTIAYTQDDLNHAELYWGEYFDCVFPNGYVLRLGHGHGRMSEESRMKMSMARKGCSLSESHRKAISLGSKGKNLSEETKHKIRLANLGKKYPEEVRAKLRLRRHSADTKMKMSVSQRARRQREREITT